MNKIRIYFKKKILLLINTERYFMAAIMMSADKTIKLLVSLCLLYLILKFGITKQGVPLWLMFIGVVMGIVVCATEIYYNLHKSKLRNRKKYYYKAKQMKSFANK